METTTGLMIERRMEYGADTLYVRVMAREGNSSFPINASSRNVLNQRFYVDNLVMRNFVSEIHHQMMSPEIEYRNIHSISSVVVLKRMSTTLTHIHNTITKMNATEPGDIFMAFAKAIDAKWYVERKPGEFVESSYNHNNWIWHPLTVGRNYYRTHF